MTKQRSTKRALLVSALALLACITLLIGSTFAWFTDSVTSAGNKIVAGTLKVDLELLDEVDGWKSIKNKPQPIFDYSNWEPGYTDVKVLKVVNNGSLALKWKAKFVANYDITALSPLADVIDVYVLPSETELAYPANRDLTGYTKVGTVAQFLNTIEETTYGTLEAEKEAYLGIALKMQESAGNTYQGLTIQPFDIQIVATQHAFEEDSFGKDYDFGLEPIDDGNILVEENNIQYVYTPDGDSVLYLVTEDYTEETVVVPAGIKTIGNYAFAYNSSVKEVILSSDVRNLGRGFDSSTVERVVLNEGLEQIDSRAFRSTYNLKEVVIPSTVKTIADNAFQKSSIKEIVIPATVETIGETAFGASMIEKVTFEGNTSIQGFAFRGCPNLRTVVLKGDDTTFIPSTLNNRNSMWFCNGESNNPNTSDITFYVENETVADRVRVAMGAEANNTTIILPVRMPAVGTPAEECSWEQLTMISEAGLAETYFRLGDTKTVTLNDGTTFTMEIVAFNTDVKTDGTPAGITWMSKELIANRAMNAGDTNAGGWEASELRAWLQGDFYATLPGDLKSAIVTVNKTFLVNKDDSPSVTLHELTCADNLWIPSSREVNPNNVGKEENGGAYDSYFTVDTFKSLITKYDLNGNKNNWWLRSSEYNTAYGKFACAFTYWSNNITFSNDKSSNAFGVVLGFCI